MREPSVSLGDLARLTVGHVGPMASEYVEAGIPFLRSLNVQPFRLELSGVKYISPEFHDTLRKSALSPGDVVVVRTGAPGVAAVIPDSLPVANCSDLVIVRPEKGLDPRFLCYLINNVTNGYIKSRIVGAVQQHFNVGAAREIPIPQVPLEEQRRIAGVLGALDDLIDTNRNLIAAQTRLAQAQFQKQFGLLNGRGGTFADLVCVVGGGTPKTSTPAYWDGDIPWFSVADTPVSGQPWVFDTEKRITLRGLEESSTKLLPERTVILSARGTVGNVALTAVPMAMNQSCYGLQCALGGKGYFTYFATLAIVERLRRMSHGSVFSTITRRTLEGLQTPVIDEASVTAFDRSVSALMESNRALGTEVDLASKTRDEFLPLLVSGRIRVRDLEGAA